MILVTFYLQMGKYRNSCITVKTQCEKKDDIDVTVLIFLNLFVTCSEELFLEISIRDFLEDVY